MTESTLGQSSFVKLKCGCVVDTFGKISQECLPHNQGNFIQ